MTQAPAGWFPQPDGSQRYWDGSAWTEHTAPGSATATPAPIVPAVGEVAPAPVAPVAEVPAIPASVSVTPAVGVPLAAPPASAPAYTAPGTAKKSRVPLILGIIGGVVLLIIVAVVLLVMFVFKATSGPRDTVNEFVSAVNHNDCEATIAIVSQRYKDDNAMNSCEGFESGEDTNVKYSIDGVTITGDTATVTGSLTDPSIDETYDLAFGLVKESGDWKIDEIKQP